MLSDYQRIAKAIEFITENVSSQPSLDTVAEQVHLSPYHFQRLFSQWAGISPKRFLQVATLERSKILLNPKVSLLESSFQLGLSSGSRLHDHFVQLEAMTPGEYKDQGAGLSIDYGFHQTPFGEMLLGATARGICCASFVDQNHTESLQAQQQRWPKASWNFQPATTEPLAKALNGTAPLDRPLSLCVMGTNFQVNVWRALLQIPPGQVTSYSGLAQGLQHQGASQGLASRAVGSAVGANPIAFFIPCHRVILKSGVVGNYRWGSTRKQVILAWERAQAELNEY